MRGRGGAQGAVRGASRQGRGPALAAVLFPPMAIAFLLAGCESGFFADPAPAPALVEIHLLLPSESSAAADGGSGGADPADPAAAGSEGGSVAADAAGRVFDRVDRVTIRLASQEEGRPLVDQEVPVDPGTGEIRLSVEVELTEPVTPAHVELELREGETLLFRSQDSVTLQRAGTARAEMALEPVGAELLLPPPPDPLEALGDTLVPGATVVFATGDTIPDAALTWTSLDPEVVETPGGEVIVAVGEGEAEVEGAFQDLSDVLVVRVEPVVVSIRVVPPEVELEPGEGRAMEVEFLDRRDNVLAPGPARWSSSDRDVATVDTGGVVTARSPGEAEIVARHDTLEGVALVTVLSVPPEVTTLDAEDVHGTSARLMAEVHPRGSPVDVLFLLGTDPSLDGPTEVGPVTVDGGLEPVTVARTAFELTPETTYFFRAEASGPAGSDEGEVREFTTPQEIPPPEELQVFWEGGLMGVFWRHAHDEPVQFQVQRALVPPPLDWSTVATTSEVEYIDEGLEGNWTYAYRVRACQDANCSTYTEPDSAYVDGDVIGTVTFGGSGDPAEGAVVSAPEFGVSDETGPDGTYELPYVLPFSQEVRIEVEMEGSHADPQTATTNPEGGPTVVDFELQILTGDRPGPSPGLGGARFRPLER